MDDLPTHNEIMTQLANVDYYGGTRPPKPQVDIKTPHHNKVNISEFMDKTGPDWYYETEEEPMYKFEVPIEFGSITGGYGHLGMTTDDVTSYAHLRQDQKDIMRRVFNLKKHERGMYLVLPTGYGKTYLLAVISQMAQFANTTVIIICPTSVSPHIRSVLTELGVQVPYIFHHKSVNLVGKIKNAALMNKNITFIVDEAHKLLTDSNEKLRNAIRTLAGREGRIFLLTATPIRKHLSDIALVRLVWPDRLAMNNPDALPDDPEQFDRLYKYDDRYNIKRIVQIIAPYVVYRKKNVDVPLVSSLRFLHSQMSYGESMNNARGREAEMTMSKIRVIANLVRESPRPVLVYSNVIEQMRIRGIDVNSEQYKLLSPFNTKYISMNVREKERQEILSIFNDDLNRSGNTIKLIFFGPGMSEGIRFHTAATLIFLTPIDRLDKYVQRIGRALSPASLTDLTGKDRKIRILSMCAVHNKRYIEETETILQTHEQLLKSTMIDLQNIGGIVDLLLGASLAINRESELEVSGGNFNEAMDADALLSIF